jgi:hypothetical protein
VLTPQTFVERGRRRSRLKNLDVKAARSRLLHVTPDAEIEGAAAPRKMKPHGWWNRKELNETLSPLFRFFRGQVGNKWDDVYSRLCEMIDRRSATGLHVLEHIRNFVEVAPFICDGVPYSAPTKYQTLPVVFTGKVSFSPQFWVDPVDGILKRGISQPASSFTVQTAQYREARKKNLRKINETTWFTRTEDGRWMRMTYRHQEFREEFRELHTGKTIVWKKRVHVSLPLPKGIVWDPKPDNLLLADVKAASKKQKKQYGLD